MVFASPLIRISHCERKLVYISSWKERLYRVFSVHAVERFFFSLSFAHLNRLAAPMFGCRVRKHALVHTLSVYFRVSWRCTLHIHTHTAVIRTKWFITEIGEWFNCNAIGHLSQLVIPERFECCINSMAAHQHHFDCTPRTANNERCFAISMTEQINGWRPQYLWIDLCRWNTEQDSAKCNTLRAVRSQRGARSFLFFAKCTFYSRTCAEN